MKEKVISIRPRTSISDLSEKWNVDDADKVVFEISKKSSFMLFVEGAALGYLQKMALSGKTIAIRLHRDTKKVQIEQMMSTPPTTLKEIVNHKVPEILCSIFGLHLLYKSEGFENATSRQSESESAKNVRKTIGETIWSTAQRSGGRLGDGKSQYLIMQHNYRIPALLRENNPTRFPKSDAFRDRLSPIIGLIKKDKVEPLNSQQLICSWVYHMAENAYAHGCVDTDNDNTPIEGYSGILIQKVTPQPLDHFRSRKDIDDDIKQHLIGQMPKGSKKTEPLISVTVMDIGNGLHNTLPIEYESYDEIERLNIAYQQGVSRHHIEGRRSGYGLSDSIRIAKELHAYMNICSGSICSSKKFEDVDKETIDFINDLTITDKSLGTSQSIAWVSKPNGK